MTREHYSSDHHELVGVELGNVSPDEDEPRYAIKRLSPGDVPQELRELPSSIQHYTDEGTGFCIFDPPSQNVVQSTNVENSNNVHVGNVTVINNGVNIYRDLRSPSPHNAPNLTDTCNGSLKKAIPKWKFIIPAIIILIVITMVIVAVSTPTSPDNLEIVPEGNYINRNQWDARQPNSTTPFTDAPFILLVKHTGGKVCRIYADCKRRVQEMQSQQMDKQNLPDIKYNFLIGQHSDKWLIFEGRGWRTRNEGREQTIDVAFIGNFTEYKPGQGVNEIIHTLKKSGFDWMDYPKLFVAAENQTTITDSPGQYVYAELSNYFDFCKHVILLENGEIICQNH